MPLEPVNFINDLVESNPVGATDQRFEGDDHIRNIKKGLKNTFPGMAGRAWRTIARQSSFALGTTDNMTFQNCTGGIVVSAAAPASLGNGFHCFLRAPGSAVSFTPGSAKVNGQDSFTVSAGHTAAVFCSGSEFFAVIMYEVVPPAIAPLVPSGTVMLFQQTSAPSGWTKVTNSTHNNAALRVVTGSVGTGGADAFTTVFGSGKSTNGHALTIAQMPSHGHTGSVAVNGTNGGASGIQGAADVVVGSVALSISNTGSGQSHSHGISDMNLKYVDIIVATKN